MQKRLRELNLPELKTREEMLAVMQENVYGEMPPIPSTIHFHMQKDFIPDFCAGKATCDKVTAVCEIGESVFSFPFYVMIPTKQKKYPFFVHMTSRHMRTIYILHIIK